MGRRINYPCACGHDLKKHWIYCSLKRLKNISWDLGEVWNPCMYCECKNYKTDNLIIVEWLAKERNLI